MLAENRGADADGTECSQGVIVNFSCYEYSSK